MTEIERALALLKQNPAFCDFTGPRAELLIENAERALGLLFPPSYREFLLRLGAGNFGSFEVYGVIGDDLNEGIPSAIGVTFRARREWSLPASMVVVGFDGGTGYFVIDTTRVGPDGESPLLRWHPYRTSPDDAHEVVALDFGSFFSEGIERELAPPRDSRGLH